MAAHSPTDIPVVLPVADDQPQSGWGAWLRDIARAVNLLGATTNQTAVEAPGGLPAEIAARIAGDAALQTELDAEEAARAAADASLATADAARVLKAGDTMTGGLVINPPATVVGATVNKTASGTLAAAPVTHLWTAMGASVFAASDSAATTTTAGNAIPTLLDVEHTFGGSTVNDGRNALGAYLHLTAPTSPTNPYRYYAATHSIGRASAADNGTVGTPAGYMAAVGGVAILDDSVANWQTLTAAELNIAAGTGSAPQIKAILCLLPWPQDRASGSLVDAVIWGSAGAGGPGLSNFIQIDANAGLYPIKAAGTVIKSIGGAVTHVFDFLTTAISGNFFQTSNATLTGGGTLTLSGNLGVGNAATGAKLQVGATATSGGAEGSGITAIISTPSDSVYALALERSSVVNPQVLYGGVNHASHYSEVQSAQSGVGFTVLALNRQGGNVAVGKATATTALDVNGAITAGSYYVGSANITAGHLPGTATNDNAVSGEVGEVISGVVTTGVAAASATVITVTTISLTAGDWDVSGEVWFATGGATIIQGAINTAAAIPAAPALGAGVNTVNAPFANSSVPVATIRLLLAGTTTVFLLGQQFGGTGATSFGKIFARRCR